MHTFLRRLQGLACLLPLAVFIQADRPAAIPSRPAPEPSVVATPALASSPQQPCQVCSFNVLTPFSSPTNEITSVSGTVDFYIVFFDRGTMSPNTVYNIATISGGCLPSANRFISIVSGGRTWLVEVASNGVFSAEITSGTAVPSGTVVDLESSYAQ